MAGFLLTIDEYYGPEMVAPVPNVTHKITWQIISKTHGTSKLYSTIYQQQQAVVDMRSLSLELHKTKLLTSESESMN